jgi:hypothetical protein
MYGVGGYSVQGITINQKYRPLPTFPIASESRLNLKSLKILKLLSASNPKYTPKELQEAITFKVTDSTSHNLGVEEMVSLELGTEHIPIQLLCHTHPVLMFVRKTVELFSKVERKIGPEKIDSSFLVNATTTHDTVTEQFIDCLTRLVAEDFNHKAWNKSTEFSIFIKPDINMAKALRKERFNRFVYLAAVVLHHRSQVSAFLEKYDTITNTLAYIVRSFEDMEFINIFLVVAALIGIHLVEPYLALTYLQSTSSADLLDVDSFAFTFAAGLDIDEVLKWDSKLLTSLKAHIDLYRPQVVKLLDLLLHQLAEGWFKQRGDVFEFGSYDTSSSKL